MSTPDPSLRQPLGPGSHAPLDDINEAPHCYPIKGNHNAQGDNFYHRPDSENYGATIAEVWFESPSAAEAAGFQLAPTHPDADPAQFEPGGDRHPCSAEEMERVRASDADDGVADNAQGAAAAGVAAAGAGAAALAGKQGPEDATETARPSGGGADEPSPTTADSDTGSGAPSDSAPSTALVDEGDVDFERVHPFGWGSHAPLVDVMEMPWCYPIKGNAESGKYHRPDSIGYPDTIAEVWFDSPSSAEAAGFVAAGSHPEGSDPADFEPGGSQHPCTAADIESIRTGQADTSGRSGIGAGKVAAAGAAGAVAAAAAAGKAGAADESGSSASAAADGVTGTGDSTAAAAASADGAVSQTGSEASVDTSNTGVEVDDVDDDGSSKKLAAGAAAAAGVAGAAALAGRGDDDDAAKADTRADTDTASGAKDSAKGGKETAKGGKQADTAKGGKEAAKGGKEAAKGGKQADTAKGGKDSAKGGKEAAKGASAKAAADAEVDAAKSSSTGKKVAGAAAAAGAAGAVAASKAGADTKGGKVAADTTSKRVAGSSTKASTAAKATEESTRRGGWWWWLLPLLLLGLLAFFLWRSCGGSDGGDTAAVAADATPTEAAEADAEAGAAAGAADEEDEEEETPTEVPTEEPEETPTEEAAEEETEAAEEETEAAVAAGLAESCPTLEDDLTSAGYGTAATLLGTSGLVTTLGDSEAITFFAPSDAALASPKVAEIAADEATLANVLSYHVVDGAVMSDAVVPGAVMTASGESAVVTSSTSGLRYNSAGITETDIESGSCVVHGVDGVAIPASLSKQFGFTSLNQAISRGAIEFDGDTPELTESDTATLEALCAYIGSTDPGELPPVAYRNSDDDTVDAARQDVIREKLASCGGEAVTFTTDAKDGAAFTG